ncbi:MAG: SDR family NAD(P)-dependent oxidoreductase, partial [Pseudomonas capeferrum]
MSRRLQGKVAFITGAGSGIGAATATRMAEEGAKVVLCGRTLAPLEAVASAIREAGGQAESAVADVSDEQAFVGAIEAAAKRHGRLDILVNNAMAYTWG